MRKPILSYAALGCALLAAGCGGVKIWPFGGDEAREQSRAPANATEFQCDKGKRFWVRYLDNGASAWVILPERQFRLDKTDSAQGTRYSNGTSTLEVNGAEASLDDGPTNSLTGCKTGAAARGAGG